MTLVAVVALLRGAAVDLLWALAQASVEGAVLATFVWLLCRAMPGMPAAVRTWLWWLVAAKLLLALLPVPGISLPVLPARPEIVAPARETPTTWAVTLLDVEPAPATTATPAVAAPTAQARRESVSIPYLTLWPIALGALWLVVAALHGRGLLRARRAARDLRRFAEPAPALIARRLVELVRQFAVPLYPRVLMSRAARSPLLTGVLQPTILLPAQTVDTWSRTDLDLVLAHELAHVRRGDLVWGWAPALAARLFFFHPLARLVTREYLTAREEACDAEVLRTLDAAPAAYGRLLVTLGVAPTDDVLAAAGSSPTFVSLQRRLLMLNQSQAPASRWWWTLTGATALLVPLSLSAASTSPVPQGATSALPTAPQAVLAPPVPAAPQPVEPQVQVPAPAPRPAPSAAPSPGQTAPAWSAPTSQVWPAPTPDALAIAIPAPPPPPPARTPEAPPAAPAPVAPATAAQPATPAAPAAPVAPPAPPAPPAMGHGIATGRRMQSEWVVLDPTASKPASGSATFRAEAERQRTSPDERLMWFRYQGQAYVTRDAATIANVQRAFDDVERTSREMGEVGRRMGDVGREHGEHARRAAQQAVDHASLTAVINRAVADQLELTAQELRAETPEARAKLREQHAARKAEIDARLAEVRAQFKASHRAAMSEDMRAMSERMKAEGAALKAMGQTLREQLHAADAQLQAIFGQAVSSGIATPAK